MTVLKNYRVKKVTRGNGEVRYYPEKKFLWFWINIRPYDDWYYTEWGAQTVIFTDYHKAQKDKVEYLPPVWSKTVRPEPNPPPNLV